MTQRILILMVAGLLLAGVGCRTEHRIEVAPMEVNLNVNVNVRVEKALDDFFGDLDALEQNTEIPESTPEPSNQ